MGFNLRLFHSGINDHNLSGVRPPRALLRFLWSHPHIYSLWTRHRHGIELFDRSYELAIDGFPRSGNSYSAKMLLVSQGNEFKFLSQCHCPPFLLAALELGTPACLTLRQPADSVVSWVILRKLPIDVVLKLYIDFHRVIYPHRTRLLVLNFDTITADFSAVVRMINLRFKMNLAVPSDPEQCKEEAFARIDQYYEKQPGGFDPLKVARPHAKRDEMKSAVRQELENAQHAPLLAQCQELYAAIDLEGQRELKNLGQSAARTS